MFDIFSFTNSSLLVFLCFFEIHLLRGRCHKMFSYNCIHVGASTRECVHFRAQSTNRLRVCNSYYLIGCCCINYTTSELKSTATQPKLHQSISNYSTTFRAVAARNQTKALISNCFAQSVIKKAAEATVSYQSVFAQSRARAILLMFFPPAHPQAQQRRVPVSAAHHQQNGTVS